MRQLISCVVLGCTLLAPGLAMPKKHQRSKAKDVMPHYDSSDSEGAAMAAMVEAAGYTDESVQPPTVTPPTCPESCCCPAKKRPWTKWTQIVNASKSQRGVYTFVQSAALNPDELCAVLGLSVPSECKLPKDVLCYATKCGFKHSGKAFNPCRKCHDDSSEDDRDSNSSSDSGQTKSEPMTWKHECKPATVCVVPTCENCQAPQLLTFDDGTDQTCEFHLAPSIIVVEDDTVKYRQFSILNGGVFDPWGNRCSCTWTAALTSVVSQQKVLTNKRANMPLEMRSPTPFTLLSMFIGLGIDGAAFGTVKISVCRGGKYSKVEELKILVSEPYFYKPSAPICDIEKIKFEFDTARCKSDHFIYIDNMLVCM